MEAAPTERGIEQLSMEIDAIHHANNVYWRSKNRSRQAIAEYYQRQVRLDGIRTELVTAL